MSLLQCFINIASQHLLRLVSDCFTFHVNEAGVYCCYLFRVFRPTFRVNYLPLSIWLAKEARNSLCRYSKKTLLSSYRPP